MHDVNGSSDDQAVRLLSPLSMIADGNERATGHGHAYTFPGGGILAGLHATVFSMQSRPLAAPGSPNVTVRTGPTPEQALARGRRKR